MFEIRALDASLKGNRRNGTIAGYFDNVDRCVAELKQLACAKGIYLTLNPIAPALLARCANRLDYAGKNTTTNDPHIFSDDGCS